MAYPTPRRRPIGIVLMAVLVILGGAVLTILALLAILAGLVLLPVLGPLVLGLAVIFLVLSLILLVAGFGLYNLRPWAWWLAMIVSFLVLARGVIAWAAPGPLSFGELLLSVVVPGLIFLYLLTVRGHFRSQPAFVPVPR